MDLDLYHKYVAAIRSSLQKVPAYSNVFKDKVLTHLPSATVLPRNT